MATFAIEYEYDPRDELVQEHRPAHRAFLSSLLARGVLLASGPLRGERLREDATGTSGTPAPAGALLLLRAASPADALSLLDGDPFRTAGLLVSRSVREWDPVTGPFAVD